MTVPAMTSPLSSFTNNSFAFIKKSSLTSFSMSTSNKRVRSTSHRLDNTARNWFAFLENTSSYTPNFSSTAAPPLMLNPPPKFPSIAFGFLSYAVIRSAGEEEEGVSFPLNIFCIASAVVSPAGPHPNTHTENAEPSSSSTTSSKGFVVFSPHSATKTTLLLLLLSVGNPRFVFFFFKEHEEEEEVRRRNDDDE
jgi:hypothetical protein